MSEDQVNEEVAVEENEAVLEETQFEAELAALEAEEAVAAPVVEEVVEAPKLSGNVKVAIKSLEFKPRGKAGTYRAGGVYVLKASEAKELVDAGIASVVEDPCSAELSFPDVVE